MSRLHIVVARSLDNVIGRNGQLPWHEPEDMKFFKELTEGSTVIMGRKTWESLPGKLVNRDNIVVTSSPIEGPDLACESLSTAIACADFNNIFVIGGAQLYAEALPLADTIYMTVVRERVGTEGAVLFPDWDPSKWKLEYSTLSPSQSVTFKKYIRRTGK